MQYDFKLAAASLAVMLNKFSRRDLGFGKVDVNIGVDEGSWHVGIVGTYLDGEPLDVQGRGWSFAEAWGQFVQLLAKVEEKADAGNVLTWTPKVVAGDGTLTEAAPVAASSEQSANEASPP